MSRLVIGLLATLLAGCATMPRYGDDVVVPCVKRTADYRWWDWPLAVVGAPVILAIWVAMGANEQAMCPPQSASGVSPSSSPSAGAGVPAEPVAVTEAAWPAIRI